MSKHFGDSVYIHSETPRLTRCRPLHCVYPPVWTSCRPHTLIRLEDAMLRTVLLAFACLCCIATCCKRKDDVMLCQEIPSAARLEGVRVLIITRVLAKQLNLRPYSLEKVMVQFSDLQCGQILSRPGTKVFLGDRLCPHGLTDRQKTNPSTTTTMMETAAIGFNTPWIIVTGILSLTISCIACCVCVVTVRKQCARRKSLQRLSAAMDDVSVTEFGFENVKLD